MAAVLHPNSIAILQKRYLDRDASGSAKEDTEGMFRRVAGGNEAAYELMANLDALPNSPALMNAGTNNGCTLFACFHFTVQDTMFDSPSGIVGTREKAARCAKGGGGVGYYFGMLRPKNAPIRSVHRKACGPVAVLRDYHGVRQLITQGGKRDLAQMGILPVWHEDIQEFIHVKDDDPKSLESFNISVSWTDEYLQGVDFTKPTPGQEPNRATALWHEQCLSAWKTGDPGMFFHDVVNRSNPTPWLGTIYGVNPCGEVPLLNDECCDLGSLNLANFVTRNRTVDWERLSRAAYVFTQFLDSLYDRTPFPHPDIAAAGLRNRKVGLGVMGWADMLALMHIPYDSQEAVQLARTVGRCIHTAAWDASLDLATEHGPYPGYDATQATAPPLRNATRTCIAPTGTISIIANCSSGIEPHYALEWNRTTYEGIKLQERIPVWDRLEGFVPKTAHEISPEWHIRHQAAWQESTDLAVSKTINLPHTATVQDISDAYRLMWELGCKGGTVYRDGCREEQVLRSTKKTSVYSLPSTEAPSSSRGDEVGGIATEGQKEQERHSQDAPNSTPSDTMKLSSEHRQRLPDRCASIRQKFRIGDFKGYLHVGLYPDGTPGEVFITASKEGSTISGLLDAWASNFSICLQYGAPLSDLCHKHMGQRFEPAGMTNVPEVPVCTSIIDFVVRWLEHEFVVKQPHATTRRNGHTAKPIRPLRSGQLCPDCGSEAVYQGGCLTCLQEGCGWSKCG